METGSDLREAYVPREPGPEVERYWLPWTRAFAIEWARQARLVGDTGLAVDDATLERVADAIMDPASPPPWQCLTAEERRDILPRSRWYAIDRYLGEQPEIDAHIGVRWRDGKRAFVVSIAGDPEAHRAALTRLAGSRVIVEGRPGARPHDEAELADIAARVRADRPALETAGLYVDWVDSRSGEVELHVAGARTEREAAEILSSRYGDAVRVVSLGPRRALEVLRPFGSWTSDGRRLRVFYGLDPNGEESGDVLVAEESDERIVIAVKALDPAQINKTQIGGFDAYYADVELRRPVGRRAVVDACAGVARPSLAELHSPH